MQKLLLINCTSPLIYAFKDLGYIVESISVHMRTYDIAAKITEMQFEPELILQQEYLGRRVLLQGLERINCLKIFWSVDTHMNMYWHGYYAELFDCVLTTQKKYTLQLKRICNTKIEWLPWMGTLHAGKSGLASHAKREHNVTFVGRVTSHRPSRKWFVDFLTSHYGLHLLDGLNFDEMMAAYRNTRIVPNEALFGEVNFRLFEAASSGCAVVTPNVGDELGELFEIGAEIEVYNDVLELKEILDRLTKKKSATASIGMAAYARILRDHLPISRATKIIQIAHDTAPRSIQADHAEFSLCMCELALGEAGESVDWGELQRRLISLERSEARDAALFRVFYRLGQPELFMELIKPYLKLNTSIEDCYFNMTASLCAVKFGQWDVAKYFWYMYAAANSMGADKPAEETQLLVYWGDALNKSGITLRVGVAFNELADIPTCASDCYFAALYRDPENKKIFSRLANLFRGVMGGEISRLGFLSHLSLHNPNDWRLSAEVGITNLKVFRFSEGLRELANAVNIAKKNGQERLLRSKLNQELPAYNLLSN
ncbi:glycosyltransferase [Maridesulfovibrio sp.]|uniref:glycosyltransferase n=1 Tax=Maridesulfovibrio sp. TaxID=2795000 RepID=UPI0029F52116|nr:glycosyltransferase [Maridesulfovibrio sp.]